MCTSGAVQCGSCSGDDGESGPRGARAARFWWFPLFPRHSAPARLWSIQRVRSTLCSNSSDSSWLARGSTPPCSLASDHRKVHELLRSRCSSVLNLFFVIQTIQSWTHTLTISNLVALLALVLCIVNAFDMPLQISRIIKFLKELFNLDKCCRCIPWNNAYTGRPSP